MKRVWLGVAFAVTLAASYALAQVPPLGSAANGWLQAIFNVLSENGASGPRTQITATFSGADTSSSTATLAAAAGKFTYICGFSVSGLGATALANGVVTITGLTTQQNYQYSMPAGATVVTTTPLNVRYSPCLPGSAVNTAIVVTVPGAAGNTSTAISADGYQR